MKKVFQFIPVIIFSLIFFHNSFAGEAENLFKANCSTCHTIGKGKLVGPDLKGVSTRHDEAWMLKWVKSSTAMIKSGDADAVKLFNDNAKLVMPDQTLNDAQIKSVIAFINEKEKEVAAAPVAAKPVSPNGTEGKDNTSLITTLGFSGYIMMLLIGLLLIVIWVMSMSIRKRVADLKEIN